MGDESTLVTWAGTPAVGLPRGTEALAAIPVVGIGASSGGLAATTELLRHIGSQPEAGVVIFHHLAPTHESGLVEILSRVTPLPVRVAADGSRVERNHVYVVPPNTRLSISDGVLRLMPRSDEAGLSLPIDAFFESLAEDCQQLAIGVVLSGSGSDGSAGIRAIKAVGGVTFAQDESAEHRSMPESAAFTGSVDCTLPPRAIAEEIVRRCAEPAWPSPDGPSDRPFQRLLTLLQESSGIDFANYKPATIRRRAQRRVFLHQLRGLAEYLDLLERDPLEAAALCEEVLIHVTSFFRDPSAFTTLSSRVYPEILAQRRKGAPIRIWVPGCSTGEEVYSIAIGLLEFLASADAADVPIQLFGTDVSASAIARARAARYGDGIQKEVSPDRLERFFFNLESGYQLRPNVREVCVFARHDATRDPPFSGMDLISCRNLMIYLGSALQDRTLSIFHYALKDPGFLLLGSSETIHTFPGFAGLAQNLYLRTPAAHHRGFDFSPELAGLPRVIGSSFTKRAEPTEIHREADRLVLAKFAPPGVIITDALAIVQFRGKTAPYLAPAPGAPSVDLMRMVREELRLPLRQTIDLARSQQQVTVRQGLRLSGEESDRVVDLEVIPMPGSSTGQRFFLVLFKEVAPAGADFVDVDASALGNRASEQPALIDQVRQELDQTREYLESVIERLEASNGDLRAANEEGISSNEELRSTNDELSAAKEEIQANNQELSTLNEQLALRNAEAKRLNEDLSNVLSSVEIPIVLIGRDAKVRRYAPAAGRVLGLTPEDIGRPMSGVHWRLATASAELAADALTQVAPRQRTLQNESGHWYQLTARPYLTRENRIDGTVLVAFNIDPIQKATERLAEAQRERADKARASSEREFRDLLATTAAGILMTDDTGRIVFVNRCALALFGYTATELVGQTLNLLMPERLRQRHDDQRSEYQTSPEPRQMSGEREVLGLRKDGRELALQITLTPLTRDSGLLVVCFITDVSARRESERRIVDYQEKLRQMSFDAAVSEERERRRIAADLHDRIGQSLALSQMKLASMPRKDNERTAVDEALELLAQSIVDTRTLIFDLSPPILYELGLKEALSWLAEDLGKRWGLQVELDADPATKPLSDESAALVFRAVRELLTNVVKHAHVSTAKITLRRQGDAIELDVEDRGVGFDSSALHASGAGASSRFGLFSVREQMQRLGGTVEIASGEKRGTRISLRVPIEGK